MSQSGPFPLGKTRGRRAGRADHGERGWIGDGGLQRLVVEHGQDASEPRRILGAAGGARLVVGRVKLSVGWNVTARFIVVCLVRSTHPAGLTGLLGRRAGGGEHRGEDLGGAGCGAGDQVVPGGRLGVEAGGARLVVGRVKLGVKRIVSAAFAFVLWDHSTHSTGLSGLLGRRAGGGEHRGEDLGGAGCGAGDQVVPDRVGGEAGGARSVVGCVKVSVKRSVSAAFAFVLWDRSTHPTGLIGLRG
jgi:hypothetical protein